MMKNDVDWNDPLLAKWLGEIVRDSTKNVYQHAFANYTEFTHETPSTLIDEAIKDQGKDPRERQDILKRRLTAFHKWLGDTKHYAPKTGYAYYNAIRSFYATYGVVLKLRGISKIPRPKVSNKRLRLTNLDVKKLVEHATTPRDRAILLVMFQSGIDVSTLCSLSYGDITRGLDADEFPLRLELHRKKAGVDYVSFLGKDAINSLKAYLADVHSRGLTISHNDPLFLMENRKRRMKRRLTPNLVQNMLRDIAVKAGFIPQGDNGQRISPVSPHALRKSFGSILTAHNVPTSVTHYLLGHRTRELDEAYQQVGLDDLAQLYRQVEPHLAISANGELEQKLRAELDHQRSQLTDLSSQLAAKNLEQERKIQALEQHLYEQHEMLINIQHQDQEIGIVIEKMLEDPDAKQQLQTLIRKALARK